MNVKFFSVQDKLRALVCDGPRRWLIVDPKYGSVEKKMNVDWESMEAPAVMPDGEGALFPGYGKDGRQLCFVNFQKKSKRALIGHPGYTKGCCILKDEGGIKVVSADNKGYVCIWIGKNFSPKWWFQVEKPGLKWRMLNVHLKIIHEKGRKILLVATDWFIEDPKSCDIINSHVGLSWWDLKEKKCIRRAKVGAFWEEEPAKGKGKTIGKNPRFYSTATEVGKKD